MLRSHEKLNYHMNMRQERENRNKSRIKKRQAEISVLEKDTNSVYQITVETKLNLKETNRKT